MPMQPGRVTTPLALPDAHCSVGSWPDGKIRVALNSVGEVMGNNLLELEQSIFETFQKWIIFETKKINR